MTCSQNKPRGWTAIIAAVGALVTVAPAFAAAPDTIAAGRAIAFDRGKGNCASCHTMKGGEVPSTVGPELVNMRSRYPDRKMLYAALYDPGRRNPQTAMPPFGRNRILSADEINAVIDFLYTL